MGNVQYLAFSNFLLVLTIYSIVEEDWTLDYNSISFEFFSSLTSFGNLPVNSYLTFTIYHSVSFVLKETFDKLSASYEIL